MIPEAEIYREYGVSLAEWLKAWRTLDAVAFSRWKEERRQMVRRGATAA